MKKFLGLVVILSVLIGSNWLSSCNNDGPKTGDPNDTLKLKSLDTAMVESLNNSISSDVDLFDSTGEKLAGKGKLWKVWEKLHTSCQNNHITKGMAYFGVSNTLGLGTVIKYEKSGKKYIPDFPMLPEKFSADQKKLIFNTGTNAQCEYQRSTKVNTEFLAKSSMTNTANGELSTAISTAKDIDVKIESWQQNVLFPQGLNTVLASDTNSYFKSYLAASKMEDRYIVNKEIMINGFAAIITTKTNISADLKAQLEKGVIEKVGDTQAQVKFTYAGERTIKATTVGTFVVFIELYKAE